MPDPKINPTINLNPAEIAQNGIARLVAENIPAAKQKTYWYDWKVTHPTTGRDVGRLTVDKSEPWVAHWAATGADFGVQDVSLILREGGKPTGAEAGRAQDVIIVKPGPDQRQSRPRRGAGHASGPVLGLHPHKFRRALFQQLREVPRLRPLRHAKGQEGSRRRARPAGQLGGGAEQADEQ